MGFGYVDGWRHRRLIAILALTGLWFFACTAAPPSPPTPSQPRIKSHHLFEGAKEGNISLIEKGLMNGEDINHVAETGYSALILSIVHQHRETMRFLLENGADANLYVQSESGNEGTPLMTAAVIGDFEAAEYLIKKGADLNFSGKTGITALLIAATYGSRSVCGLLIKNGANINHQDSNGYTPLMAAAANGHMETIDVLLEHEADINMTMTSEVAKGSTALAAAVGKGHADVVSLLLSKGADMNIPITLSNNYVIYPLIGAAMNGNSEMVDLLIKNGADVNVKASDGRSAIEFAKERGHLSIIWLLEQAEK